MGDTAIRATCISKEYTIDHSYTNSFKELMARIVFHSRKPDSEKTITIKVLDKISFEVKQGESLGIIGKNGAGKSTLLKILSGITKLTSGQVEIFGRMNSILDIGVGFHPELTGRENIFLSGELNGLNRKEISKRLDEIIDFSGVEQFIDTPVKYYSSGMFLRLAFSVFTGIDSDILLLDEVMSVGDAEFQLKSSRKLQSMFTQGKTILLVSHNPADIMKLCNRVLLLEGGIIKAEGSSGKILSYYVEKSILEAVKLSSTDKPVAEENGKPDASKNLPKLRNVVNWENQEAAPGNEYFLLRKIVVRNQKRSEDDKIYVDEEIVVEVHFEKQNDSESIHIALRFNDINGNPLFVASPSLSGKENELRDYCTEPGQKILTCLIQDHLFNSSTFVLDLFISDKMKTRLLLSLPYVLAFTTHFKEIDENLDLYKKDYHPIFPLVNWKV